ncbi:MAG: GspH/FimT family pseudopilin [Planctomycetota bacterium]
MKTPTSSTGERRGSAQRSAFTLIELMVVIVVIGVLAAITVPRFSGSFERAALRSEAQSLADAMRYARSQAIIQRRVIRLAWLDDVHDQRPGDQPGYRLEIQQTDPLATEAFVALNHGAVKPHALAHSVMLHRFAVAGDPDAKSMLFFPTGLSQAASIQLYAGSLRQAVSIDPYTGAVATVDSWNTPPISQREDLDA